MSNAHDSPLPEGVRLSRGEGDEPIELTIRAADANQLAWRIHDLVPLIQSGRLAEIIRALPGGGPARQRGSK